MNISIFGMGYVGCVTAACLIKQGHKIIGVDINDSKIEKLNDGIWPIYEPGLNELNKQNDIKNKFFATNDDVLALDKNYGFGSAYNLAFKHLENSNDELVLILNNDTIVVESLLKNLLSNVDKYGNENIYGPKILLSIILIGILTGYSVLWMIIGPIVTFIINFFDLIG